MLGILVGAKGRIASTEEYYFVVVRKVSIERKTFVFFLNVSPNRTFMVGSSARGVPLELIALLRDFALTSSFSSRVIALAKSKVKVGKGE